MEPSTFASGTLFSRIFHASPVGMTINAIPEGWFVDVNESYAELIGYSREEIIGRRAVDLNLVIPARRESVVQNLLEHRALSNTPVELRHRSGQKRHVIVSAQIEEFEGQLYSVAMIQDLTEYRQAQEALSVSEARFRLFFESVPLPVWVFDLETLQILDANPAAAATYGYSIDELLSMTIMDVRSPLDQEALREFLPHMHDAMANIGVWKHRRKDGTQMDMAITGYTFTLHGRRVRLAVLRDVTEQLAAERAVVESEQRLKIITELSTDGIWDLDVNTGSVQVNEAFRTIYGAPERPEEVLAWWLERIHPEDRLTVLESIQEVVALGNSYWSGEYRMLRANGKSYVNVLARGHVLREGGQPVRIIGALVDITVQMEVAEAAARAALEERQRLARDLHDSVTQSLYSVTLLSEVARRRAEAGDHAATLDQITRLGELAQQCLREMRLLVYELRPALVEEVGLVGALQHRLEAVEQRSGVRVTLVAGDDQIIPRVVQNELFRVAEEALNNALKHARASRLSVQLRTSPVAVELEISDNGRGFDADAAIRSGGQGLRNMRERVDRLGGDFTLQTTPEGHTTITVRVSLGHGATAFPDRALTTA